MASITTISVSPSSQAGDNVHGGTALEQALKYGTNAATAAAIRRSLQPGSGGALIFSPAPCVWMPPARSHPRTSYGAHDNPRVFRLRRVAHCALLDARRPLIGECPSHNVHTWDAFIKGDGFAPSIMRCEPSCNFGESGASRQTTLERLRKNCKCLSAIGFDSKSHRRAELESRSNSSLATATREGISDFTATS